jgi:hypothetical protein
MRKLFLILAAVLIVFLALAMGAFAWTIGQLDDPNSGSSAAFKARFAEGCVTTASESEPGAASALTPEQRNDLAAVCNCAAENVRQDIAESGLGATLHMLMIEGPKAKLLRALDSCQTTPSAP